MDIIIKVLICNKLESDIFKIIIKDTNNNIISISHTNKYGIFLFHKNINDIYFFEIISNNLYPEKIECLIYKNNITVYFQELHKINITLTDYFYPYLPIEKGEILLG